jgi:hypothetical protein
MDREARRRGPGVRTTDAEQKQLAQNAAAEADRYRVGAGSGLQLRK